MLNDSWILIGQPKSKNPFTAGQSDFMVLFSPSLVHMFQSFFSSKLWCF